MPTSILACLNNNISKTFQTERSEYYSGTRSLRTYRRDIPIPIRGIDVRKISKIEASKNYSFMVFSIPFVTYLGNDFHDKRMLMEQLFKKEINLRTSSISLEKDKGTGKLKIFLLASFEYQNKEHAVDPKIIAEASLSIEVPIVVKINRRTYDIGNKEEFMYRRLAIQQAVNRIKKNAVFNTGGHGRSRKLKSLDKYRDAEANYVDNKLHLYSRRLIDLCIKHRVGCLFLTNYSEAATEAKAEELLLRNWSYRSLKDKICYKASMAGILVKTE